MAKKRNEYLNFTKGVLELRPTITDMYGTLMTHPMNKDRVEEVIEWKCKGFLGYKK